MIAGTFLLAHLLGMPGVRRTTAAIIAMMILAYLIYRFSTRIDLSSLSSVKPGKASTLGQYLSNLIASFVMFWVGLPVDGDWAQWSRFLLAMDPDSGRAGGALTLGRCLAPGTHS